MLCPKCGADMGGQNRCPRCGHESAYGGNTTFYRKAQAATLSFKDIFSDVFKRHGKADGERLFTAGTAAATPRECDILKEWRKPWLFAWVGIAALAITALMYYLMAGIGAYSGFPLFMIFGASVVPVAVLLFYWEMNIPRNIPIYAVLLMVLVGGALSSIATFMVRSLLGMDAGGPAYLLGPIPEEIAKLLALCLFLYPAKNKYILNGILIGGAIGVGFALMETAGYAFQTFTSIAQAAGRDLWKYSDEINSQVRGVLVMRGVLAPGGHCVWAALYGGALAGIKGAGKLRPAHFAKPQFLGYFAAAILLHTAWNFDWPWYTSEAAVYLTLGCLTVLAWVLLLRLLRAGVQQVLAVVNAANAGPWSPAAAVPVGAGVAPPAQSPAPAPPVAQGSLCLRGLAGEYGGQSIPLGAGTQLVLGRDPAACNLIFPAATPGISRRHCALRSDGQAVYLSDLGSSNGTFLEGGQRLAPGQEVALRPGQRFYLASRAALFEVV